MPRHGPSRSTSGAAPSSPSAFAAATSPGGNTSSRPKYRRARRFAVQGPTPGTSWSASTRAAEGSAPSASSRSAPRATSPAAPRSALRLRAGEPGAAQERLRGVRERPPRQGTAAGSPRLPRAPARAPPRACRASPSRRRGSPAGRGSRRRTPRGARRSAAAGAPPRAGGAARAPARGARRRGRARARRRARACGAAAPATAPADRGRSRARPSGRAGSGPGGRATWRVRPVRRRRGGRRRRRQTSTGLPGRRCRTATVRSSRNGGRNARVSRRTAGPASRDSGAWGRVASCASQRRRKSSGRSSNFGDTSFFATAWKQRMHWCSPPATCRTHWM